MGAVTVAAELISNLDQSLSRVHRHQVNGSNVDGEVPHLLKTVLHSLHAELVVGHEHFRHPLHLRSLLSATIV